jgi:hypothetical protein
MPSAGREFQSKPGGDCAAICGTQASVACNALERTQLASHRGGAAAPTEAAAATPFGVATGGEACWARATLEASTEPSERNADAASVLKTFIVPRLTQSFIAMICRMTCSHEESFSLAHLRARST